MQQTANNPRNATAPALRFARGGGSRLVRLLAGLLLFSISSLWFETGLLAPVLGLPSKQYAHAELQSPYSIPQGDVRYDRNHSLRVSTSRGYIEESIPEKYKGRYRQWKNEFLETEAGRQQWEVYEHHPTLILTITVSRDLSTGATAGNFNWDESGNLTGATISLGSKIDQGYPSPASYPVLNSLKRLYARRALAGSILAAAKIAHEFEHINQASSEGLVYRAKNEMIKIYNARFLENGHNSGDPKLLELAVKMGGTPVEICEDREHGSEIKAMHYLFERLRDNELRHLLLVSIKETISFFAKSFQQRYSEFIRAEGLSDKRLALAAKTER